MIKKVLPVLFAVCGILLAAGCNSAPEYYEELSEAEQKQLLHSARSLALQGKAVPEHYRALFLELPPYQRIVYNGSKRGKATFRWEIYGNVADRRNLTQKDINPYWIMVYATGDLTDPKWKLSHAYEDPSLQTIMQQKSGKAADSAAPAQSPVPVQRKRQVRKVRLR